MKKGNFLSLVYCFVVAGMLVSAHGYSKDNPGEIPLKEDSIKHQRPIDYTQRQKDIRSHILKMFPGTYLDSMGLVINLLSDSLRKEILKTKTKDSLTFFNTCLNNTLKDSMLLYQLGKLSPEGEEDNLDLHSVFTAHCISTSNSAAIDSVAMDVFSGNALLASAVSDSLGIIRLRSIPEGTYSIVFSRRGYAPLSLAQIKIAAAHPVYIDIPLNKQGGYLAQLFNNNNWILLAAAVLILLLIIGFLAYLLAKRKVKKQNKTKE
jgi:hypothetical protein